MHTLINQLIMLLVLIMAFQALLFFLFLSIADPTILPLPHRHDDNYTITLRPAIANTSLYYSRAIYMAAVGVGTPPQTQYLMIDTGSDVTWAQCQPCHKCYLKEDFLFNPNASTSFAHRRIFEINYAGGFKIRGTMATENIALGGVTVPSVPFGCAHSTEGNFNQADGMLGLGWGSLSFVSGRAFSYCLSSSYSSGWLGFGHTTVGAKWAALIHNFKYPSFYYVELVGILVGGEVLDIPADMFRISPDTGEGGVVLDTGTRVTRLPLGAYVVLRDRFIKRMMMDNLNLNFWGGGYSYAILDTCYNLNGIDLGNLIVPAVAFNFSSRGMDPPFVILDLEPRNVLYEADRETSTFCLAFAPTPLKYSIIGNMHQQGTQITVDTLGGFIGFGPGVC